MRQGLFPSLLYAHLRGKESAGALPIFSNLTLSTTLQKCGFSAPFLKCTQKGSESYSHLPNLRGAKLKFKPRSA